MHLDEISWKDYLKPCRLIIPLEYLSIRTIDQPLLPSSSRRNVSTPAQCFLTMASGKSLPQNGYFEHTSLSWYEGRPDTREETVDVSLDGQYLCHVCQNLRARILEIWQTRQQDTDATLPALNERLPHHKSTYALTEGYLKGCTFCALIWNSLSNVHRRKPTLADLRQWREMWTQSMRLGGSVDLIATSHSRDELILWPRFFGPRGEVSSVRRRCYLSVARTVISHRPPPFTYGTHGIDDGALTPPISTSAPAAIDHAVRTLKECHETHEQCKRVGHGALPTRLLEINGNDSVRCVDGASLAEDTRYTTLSYCWGKQASSTVMQLTMDSLADFAAGFPLELLPKTVREAIDFTRRIGLRHIWVDLLCIIQDSPEDKATEIQAMASIYEGSHLTVCALGAESMDGGLYSLRNPLLYSSIPLTEANDGKRLHVRFQMSDDAWWWWPAHKRGWIYQERILSRRMLSFGPYLVWNCRQTMIKEFDIALSFGDGRFVLSSRLYQSLVAPEESGEDRAVAIYRAWHEVLHHYHFTDLRFRSDRLAAVTGVISLVKRQTGWENHMGLWEPFLLRELLWEPSVRPVYPSGLGPSWSWIAWDGRIDFKAPEHPLGADSGGYELAAAQRVAHLQSTGSSLSALPCIRLDCVPLRVLTVHRKESIPNVEVQDWPFPGLVQYTPDGEETDRAAEFLLPCMLGDMYVYGLMVARSTRASSAGEPLYERVGFVKALKGKELVDAAVYWDDATREKFETKLRGGPRKSFLLV